MRPQPFGGEQSRLGARPESLRAAREESQEAERPTVRPAAAGEARGAPGRRVWLVPRPRRPLLLCLLLPRSLRPSRWSFSDVEETPPAALGQENGQSALSGGRFHFEDSTKPQV